MAFLKLCYFYNTLFFVQFKTFVLFLTSVRIVTEHWKKTVYSVFPGGKKKKN